MGMVTTLKEKHMSMSWYFPGEKRWPTTGGLWPPEFDDLPYIVEDFGVMLNTRDKLVRRAVWLKDMRLWNIFQWWDQHISEWWEPWILGDSLRPVGPNNDYGLGLQGSFFGPGCNEKMRDWILETLKNPFLWPNQRDILQEILGRLVYKRGRLVLPRL